MSNKVCVCLERFDEHENITNIRKQTKVCKSFIQKTNTSKGILNDVPRLKQLISVCVRQIRGISYIVEKLNKAIAGIYNPKGYAEFDKDLAAFVLIAGGPI